MTIANKSNNIAVAFYSKKRQPLQCCYPISWNFKHMHISIYSTAKIYARIHCTISDARVVCHDKIQFDRLNRQNDNRITRILVCFRLQLSLNWRRFLLFYSICIFKLVLLAFYWLFIIMKSTFVFYNKKKIGHNSCYSMFGWFGWTFFSFFLFSSIWLFNCFS